MSLVRGCKGGGIYFPYFLLLNNAIGKTLEHSSHCLKQFVKSELHSSPIQWVTGHELWKRSGGGGDGLTRIVGVGKGIMGRGEIP